MSVFSLLNLIEINGKKNVQLLLSFFSFSFLRNLTGSFIMKTENFCLSLQEERHQLGYPLTNTEVHTKIKHFFANLSVTELPILQQFSDLKQRHANLR